MSRKNVLILSFSPLLTDSRVRRQISTIAHSHTVIAVGYEDPMMPNIQFIEVPQQCHGTLRRVILTTLLLSRRFSSYYWSLAAVKHAMRVAPFRKVDLIVANDPSTLPLACENANSVPVVYDAHEYATEKQADDWRWRAVMKPYYSWILRTYLPRVNGMMTVSDGIADAYETAHGIKPVVVRNAPSFANVKPSDVQHGSIRLVHQGNAIRRRRLEDLIDAVLDLDDRFTLDFFLKESDSRYLEQLKTRAASCRRIRFCDPVPPESLINTLSSYDVGVYLMPPANFNMANALPNKLFEFIQARLCVAIGPTPEMATIVQRYRCGYVATAFSAHALAETLRNLSVEQIQEAKMQSDLAARELCFESEATKLNAVVEHALKT